MRRREQSTDLKFLAHNNGIAGAADEQTGYAPRLAAGERFKLHDIAEIHAPFFCKQLSQQMLPESLLPAEKGG